MDTDSTEVKGKELTERIIGVFYKVYNALGYGLSLPQLWTEGSGEPKGF
jgi:hypothetical protein